MFKIICIFILLCVVSCTRSFEQKMIGKWVSNQNPTFTLEILEEDDHFYLVTAGTYKRLAYLDRENKILNVANSYQVSLGANSDFADIVSSDVNQFIYISKDDKIVMRNQSFTRIPTN